MAEVGEQDQVHVFASAHPKVAPSYIVKMLKGTCPDLFKSDVNRHHLAYII